MRLFRGPQEDTKMCLQSSLVLSVADKKVRAPTAQCGCLSPMACRKKGEQALPKRKKRRAYKDSFFPKKKDGL